MSTVLQAPYPSIKVTSVLPNCQFEDSRTPQAKVLVKRSREGRLISYVQSTDRQTLKLPFILTRQKALELEAFVQIYRTADWKVTLYDGSEWIARLTANPFERVTTERSGDSQGGESVELTLELSAEPL